MADFNGDQSGAAIEIQPDTERLLHNIFAGNTEIKADIRAAITEADAAIHLSGALDTNPPRTNDVGMNTPTREEIDAKLEAMEAKMDARVATVIGKMDTFIAQASGSERAMSLLAERATAAAESAVTLKHTMWITSITTILAVLGIALAAYFGTQQSNIGIVQSTIAAFESGRNAGSSTPPPASPAPSPKK